MTVSPQLRVDLQLGGAWTDITSKVFLDPGVTITRGRNSESATATAGSAALSLNNQDGRFSPRNTAGAYYPNFNRNTPIRIGVGTPPQGAATGNQVASTTVTAPATVAETAGLAIAGWAQESSTTAITVDAGYTAASQVTGALSALRTGRLAVAAAGAVAATNASATVSAPGAGIQVFLPGTSVSFIAIDNGARNADAFDQYLPLTTGTFTLTAGDVLVAVCAWSTDTRNAMVCPPQTALKSNEWTLVADTGPTANGTPRLAAWAMYAPTAGATTVAFPNWLQGYADTLMAVYQLRGVTNWNPRFTGACSDIATDPVDATDVRTTLVCGSGLRQANQGTQPARDPIWRQAVGSPSLAYWPMTGGTVSSSAPSPLSGVPNATIFGAYAAGNNSTSYPFSDALGTFTAPANAIGVVPFYTTATQVAGGCYGAIQLSATDPTKMANAAFLMAQTWSPVVKSTTAAAFIFLQYNSDTTVNLVVQDKDYGTITGAALQTITVPGGVTSWLAPTAPFWVISWCPNATNPTTQTDFQVGMTDTVTGFTGYGTVVTATCTVGPLTAVWLGREPQGKSNFTVPYTAGHLGAMTGGTTVSGVFIATDTVPTTNTIRAGSGWLAEDRFARQLRLAQEAGIPFSHSRVNAAATQPFGTSPESMGYQPSSTPLELILLAAATDVGELFEPRGINGLAYVPTADMSAQAAVVTLDYTANPFQGLGPVDDDSTTRNDVSAQQVNGPTARATLNTGALSTRPVPNGVGTYATSTTVSVWQQGRDLGQIASWLLHLGTVNESRLTAIRIPLAAAVNAGNVTVVSAVDVGQRIDLTNLPTWVGATSTSQSVIGVTEAIGAQRWDVTLCCRPYTPFAVLRLGTAGYGELGNHYLGLNR